MPSLAMIRDVHLNPWDCGNYYGLVNHGVKLYLCGRGDSVPWAVLKELYPQAELVKYTKWWEPLELEPDVVDVADAHYAWAQYYVKRHPKTVVVAWDNLPGKNTLSTEAIITCQDAWKHVARSRGARDMLVWDGVSPDRIRIIPGAIDTQFFAPDKLPRENAVLFVGRLLLEKGLLDLIWAMKGLDAELWIAGEGDQAYFQQWIDRTGITVRWLNFLSREQVAMMYRRAKVFCVPSLPKIDHDPYACWLEQFGQVFIEAMASGTPVVSTLSGAIPEVVGDGGLLVAPRDFGALSLKLQLLLGSERKWKTVSENARRRAVNFYSQDVVGKQIKEWYFD